MLKRKKKGMNNLGPNLAKRGLTSLLDLGALRQKPKCHE